MTAGAELAEGGRLAAVQVSLQQLEEEVRTPSRGQEEVLAHAQSTAEIVAELRSALRPKATADMEARLLEVLSALQKSVAAEGLAEGSPSAAALAATSEALGTV